MVAVRNQGGERERFSTSPTPFPISYGIINQVSDPKRRETLKRWRKEKEEGKCEK